MSIVAATVVGNEVQVYTKTDDVFKILESEFIPLQWDLLESQRIADCQNRSLNDLKDAIVKAQLKIGEWKCKNLVAKNVAKRIEQCQAKANESRKQFDETNAKLRTLLDQPNHNNQSEVKALLAKHENLETELGNLSCQSTCLSSELQRRISEIQTIEKEKSAAEAAISTFLAILPVCEKSFEESATNFIRVKEKVSRFVNDKLFLAQNQRVAVVRDLKEKEVAIQSMTEGNKFHIRTKIVDLQSKQFTLTSQIAFWEHMQKIYALPKEIVIA